jgi:hypothetical protein
MPRANRRAGEGGNSLFIAESALLYLLGFQTKP